MEAFIGSILLFAGTYAPRDWLFCHGQQLPIQQHAALYSILGTTYGGNGTTTFNLPDLRGRVPLQAGQGPGLSNYPLGQAGGLEVVTLTHSQLPPHNHGVQLATGPGAGPGLVPGPTAAAPQTVTTQLAGTGNPHENRQPFLALNYIICVVGLYPERP